MSNQEKATLVESFQALFSRCRNMLEIDFSIKLFGVPVFTFHYPPQHS